MTEQEFIVSLKSINIQLSETQLKQLQMYYELLVEWNEKMNLTAITSKEDVYLKHFYDSITPTTVIDLEKEQTLCDVGTGAGFPGIVLKIVYPHLKLTLVDALNKRLLFLQDVCNKLELKNVQFIHSRAEDYAKENREIYDVVIARAVANMSTILEYCIPLVKEGKYFIAMKGKENEILLAMSAAKKLNVILIENKELLLPFENSVRNIVKWKKISKTNQKYPRKMKEIKKKPL